MKPIIIGIIGILIAASVFILIYASKNQSFTASPVPSGNSKKPVITKSASTTPTLTYKDPSGFEFQYPEGITVNQVDQLNEQLFSSLELSSKNKPKTVTLKVEVSNLDTIDEWFNGNRKSSIFGKINNVKLADLDAREFQSNNSQILIALDQGALFTITTASKSSDPIYNVYKLLITSFKFVQPDQSDASADVGTSGYSESDIIDEGEEVIE